MVVSRKKKCISHKIGSPFFNTHETDQKTLQKLIFLKGFYLIKSLRKRLNYSTFAS